MPHNKHSSSKIVSGGVCGVVAPLLGLTGLWSSRIRPHPALPAEYFGVQSAGSSSLSQVQQQQLSCRVRIPVHSSFDPVRLFQSSVISHSKVYPTLTFGLKRCLNKVYPTLTFGLKRCLNKVYPTKPCMKRFIHHLDFRVEAVRHLKFLL